VALLLLWMTPTATAQLVLPSQVYCATDRTAADVTVLGLGLGGIPAPAPIDGVLTGWAVHVGPDRGRFEQRVQVFRRVDGPLNRFLAVAESGPRMVPTNSKEAFKTRIPVEAGDFFALRGTVETFLCRGMSRSTSALHEGPTPIGSTYEFKAETGLGVPLEVFVEEDGDGDGYGDETQDRCPRAPTTQDGCPAVELRVEDAIAKKGAILLRVSIARAAKVEVFGSVTYPFGPPGTGGSGVELIGGRVETVRPGRTVSFAIGLPKRLRQHLRERPPRRFLKAKMTVGAISVDGREAERKLTVRLPGRKGP
jgi:hypothetical protein